MPVAEKTRHMTEVQVNRKRFKVSDETAARIMVLVRSDAEESIPYEEAFPRMKNRLERGASVLKGFRYRDGLTQAELAAMIEVTQGDLSKMEAGKRPIGLKVATRLAKVFKTDPRVFR
jgi:DNA-binding XRE family transcriptional regulator